ncbi:MAG: hypothetical protein HeimC3_06130 [Candidatus Heimdallarchaeota archaeon LC_3]|nr:MAG: hypothetical protein HeimC3_06130 [Candidatus Heimdallarchaeota archaeon LC_3]
MSLVQIPWSVFNNNKRYDLSPILKSLSPLLLEYKFIKGISIIRVSFYRTNMKLHKEGKISEKDVFYFLSSIIDSLSVGDKKDILSLNKNDINTEEKAERRNLIEKISILISLDKLKINYEKVDNSTEKMNISKERSNFFISSLISYYQIFQASGSIILRIVPLKSGNIRNSFFSIQLEVQIKLFNSNELKSEKERFYSFKRQIINYLEFYEIFYHLKKVDKKLSFLLKWNFFFRKQLDNTLFSLTQTYEFLKFPENLISQIDISKFDTNSLNNIYTTSKGEENDSNKIPIGFKINPNWFPQFKQYITKSDLASHISCFGLTSQGKSRFIYNLLVQFSKTNINFLILDSKGEYIQSLSNNLENIHYYKIGSKTFNLYLNIFETPKGLDKEDHHNFLYTLFLHIVGESATPQMLRILYKAIKITVSENGNFNKFLNYIDNPKILGIQGAYLELSVAGLMNRIHPLTSGISGKCFNVENSNINYNLLMNNNIIIDLSLFEETENNMIRKTLVNVLYYYFINYIRKTRGKIRNPDSIRNVIIVEEAQKLVPVNYNGKNELSTPLGMSTWTARAYGVSMLFVATDPILESSVISNTGITILFYGKYDYKISRMLNISNENFSELIHHLRERQRFLYCNKGEIQLCRSFNYDIPSKESIAFQYFKFIRKKHILKSKNQ